MNWLSKRTGFELAVLANVLWGTSFLASKHALLAWGPYTTAFMRLSVALAAFHFFGPKFDCRVRRPKNLEEWIAVTTVGLLSFAVLYPLQFAGLQYIPSALSAAIMLTAPLVLLALQQLFTPESPCPRKYVAVGLGMIGGLLLLFPGKSFAGVSAFSSTHVTLGIALTFGAALSLAFSIVAVQKAPRSLGHANLAFWSIAVSVVILLPFAWNESSLRAVSWSTWTFSGISLLYLGVICTALCTLLWHRAIALCSDKKSVAPTMHLKTPVAVLLGPLLAGEAISPTLVVGVLMILVAVVIISPSQTKETLTTH